MRIKDARQTFLGVWLQLIVQGKAFEVWDGSQLRDFTYVDDAVNAFIMAATSEAVNGKAFNLGGDCVISLKQLAELLIDVNGGGEYHTRCFPSDRRRIDIGDYYSDYTHIKSTLGWEPRVGLRVGLSTTLDYYRCNLRQYI